MIYSLKCKPKKLTTMTYQEQGQFTKKNSDDLLTELSNYQGENLINEIVRLGIQNLMELERDEHIGVGNYERGEDRRSQRNGYKSRQLYTQEGTLVLQVPQTRDGMFFWWIKRAKITRCQAGKPRAETKK